MDSRKDQDFVFYCYGRKGYAKLTQQKHEIERYFHEPILEKIGFRDAASVAQALVAAFEKGSQGGGVDEVVLLYTEFVSMARFVATAMPFLPLTAIEETKDDAARKTFADYILEPSPQVIFDRLVPKYLETTVFSALIQSVTSEYASRRMAMKNATDAANDMVGRLKRTYNRVRQEGITKELLDIVGGAEALR